VLVTAASVQDNAGGQALIRQLAAVQPDVTRIWAGAGYKRAVAGEGAAHGMQVEVYTKPAGLKGFHATPRWPAERTFGWLMLHRRHARDYETLPERSITMIHWSMTDNLSRRLTGESTPTWRTEPARTDEPTAA
jgi:hypothetical protein